MLEKTKNIILRPLAVFSFSFFVFSSVLFSAEINYIIPATVFSVLSLLFFVLKTVKRKSVKISALFFALFMLCFGLCTASLFTYYQLTVRLGAYDSLDGKEVSFTGCVSDIEWQEAYAAGYTVDADTVNGESFDGKISVTSDCVFQTGEKIRGVFTAETIKNDNEYREYYLSDNILLKGECTSAASTGETVKSITVSLVKLRNKLSRILLKYLGDDAGGFCSALFLGDKSHLPASVTRDFRRLGISHILALSGMHLSVVFAILGFALKKLHVNAKRIITVFCTLFYMALTGFSLSVVRAGIMLIVLMLSGVFRRRGDLFTNLGIALIVITAVSPMSPIDMGLRLSASAVFAIGLATKSAEKKEIKPYPKRSGALYYIRSFENSLHTGLFIAISVVIFLLPLQWIYSCAISPLSPLCSVVFSFAATVLLWLIPLILIFSGIDFFAAPLSHIARVICELVFSLAERISSIKNISTTISYKGSAFLCVSAAVMFIIFAVSKKKLRLISGILSLITFAAVFAGGYALSNSTYESPVIYPIAVNKNDCLICYCENISTIIDISDGKDGAMEKSLMELRTIGAANADNLVITHWHNYYMSTIKKMTEKYLIYNVFIPETENNKDIISTVEKELKRSCRANILCTLPEI